MPAPTRPYAAIPADAGKVLRPVLPPLADEIIVAIAREVPDYARAMEGEFGQVVRVGDREGARPLHRPDRGPVERRRPRRAQTYVDLGRGEMRAGRSLDALLSAYRARLPAGVAALRRGGRRRRPRRRARSTRSARRSSPTSTSSRRVGGGLRRGAVGRRRASASACAAASCACSRRTPPAAEETILAAAAAAAGRCRARWRRS